MRAATRSRNFGSPRRAARPRLEPHEPRLPLAATAGLAEAVGDVRALGVPTRQEKSKTVTAPERGFQMSL